LAARVVAGVALAAGAAIRPARPHAPTAGELAAHVAFLAKLSDPLWLKV
jgi:DNA polymerase-3 subunit epsilon